MRALVLLLATVLAVAPAQAATRLSLPEAEAKAAAANPRLAAARQEAAAAAHAAAASTARRAGSLDLVGAYDRFESPRLVRPMSIDLFTNPAGGFAQLPWDEQQVHYGVSWQLPLLAGGAIREGIRASRLAHSAAESQAVYTRDEVRTAVRATYRDALFARHAVAAAAALREALAKDDADARLAVELGARAPVDAAKVTFALRGAEAQVAALEARARTAQAELAALLGEALPEDGYDLEEIGAEPAALEGVDLDPALDAALAPALASRADLAAVRAQAAIAESRKRLARDAFGPRLGLEARYVRNDAPSVSGALDTHEVSLRLELPLFDGGARRQAVRAADAALAAARERARGKELEVATQLADARGRLAAARAELAAAQEQRALGHRVAQIEKVRLEQGAGKVEDYLVARGQELAGETAYWSALYGVHNALDRLALVSGQGEQP